MNSEFVCNGNLYNKKFNILLKIKKPRQIPIKIGKRNLKFSLGALKKSNTLFNNFSYIPNITHKTPLLIPGKIAPEPINIPLKILVKVFINPP